MSELLVQGDVTDRSDVTPLVDTVVGRRGRLDVLVRNAMARSRHLVRRPELRPARREARPGDARGAPADPCRATGDDRGPRRGRLVYLFTGLSRRPRAAMTALGVAESALNSFVRHVAEEVAPHGVTANVVARRPSPAEDGQRL